MKPHLIVKLARALPSPPPSWQDALALENADIPTRSGHAAFDKALTRSGVPVSLTAEYTPRLPGRWSADELASGLNRLYRLVLQEDTTFPPALIQAISLLPDVEYVRPIRIGQTVMPRPTAATLSSSTAVEALRYPIYEQLKRIHEQNRGNADLIVAVLDTGIYAQHAELKGRLLPGYDFVNIIDGAAEFIGDSLGADPDPEDDWVGHGTHVAGIVAATGLHMQTGVVPNCRILPVRVLGALRRGNQTIGAGLVDNINTGIKWAVDQGAQVINMSLGVRFEGGGLPHAEVIDYARRRDVTIVAAAGNDGLDNRYYPGASPHVIAVGAHDPAGNVTGFSTYGTHLSVVAPGMNIYSSFLHGEYVFSSGTSQASPFVAGAVALLKSAARQQGHTLSDNQVKYLLKHTSDKTGRAFKDIHAGYGRLNIPDALRLLGHRLHPAT